LTGPATEEPVTEAPESGDTLERSAPEGGAEEPKAEE